jgi:predicted SnoaL-like aldol condensation-catalyzing enzyme
LNSSFISAPITGSTIPTIEDGSDGLRKYLSGIAANYPNAQSKILRVFADGEHVILPCPPRTDTGNAR